MLPPYDLLPEYCFFSSDPERSLTIWRHTAPIDIMDSLFFSLDLFLSLSLFLFLSLQSQLNNSRNQLLQPKIYVLNVWLFFYYQNIQRCYNFNTAMGWTFLKWNQCIKCTIKNCFYLNKLNKSFDKKSEALENLRVVIFYYVVAPARWYG